jgi:membrane-associated phospholipid phosphatase
MQNHPIVDTDENIILEESYPRPLRIRCAQCISNALAPITISLPLIVVVAFYHARNLFAALSYALITLFFVSLAPATYVLIGVRQGKISDLEVSNRKERAGPFLCGIMSTIVGLFILLLTNAPKNLETLLYITGVSGIVMTLTTLWWKISIHAATLAGAATVLTTLYGIVMLPTYLLVVLAGWSRVVLRRHTVAQVVVGSLVSIVLTAVILKVRGV